jgi:hypothetical protein
MERKGVGKARSSRGGKRAARVELTERGGDGGWRRPVRVPTARGRIRD